MKQSLQRTRKMMAEQLGRVAQVSEVMGEQDALLRDTFAEHQASAVMRACGEHHMIPPNVKRAGECSALRVSFRFGASRAL